MSAAAAAALDDFDESSDDFVDSCVSAAKVDPKDAFAAERSIPKLVRKADWDDIEDSLSVGRCFAARVDAEAASFALAEKQRVLLKPEVRNERYLRWTCHGCKPWRLSFKAQEGEKAAVMDEEGEMVATRTWIVTKSELTHAVACSAKQHFDDSRYV